MVPVVYFTKADVLYQSKSEFILKDLGLKWLEKCFFNFENLSSFSGLFERRKNLLTMRFNVEPIIPLGFALLRIFLNSLLY